MFVLIAFAAFPPARSMGILLSLSILVSLLLASALSLLPDNEGGMSPHPTFSPSRSTVHGQWGWILWMPQRRWTPSIGPSGMIRCGFMCLWDQK